MTVCAFSETFIYALKNVKSNINTILCIIRKTTTKKEMAENSKFKNPLSFSNHLHKIVSKQVVMQVPVCSCSYFNYKKTLRIVFLVISDAKYEFKIIYAGEANRKRDSCICDKSTLGTIISKNLILLPQTNNDTLI